MRAWPAAAAAYIPRAGAVPAAVVGQDDDEEEFFSVGNSTSPLNITITGNTPSALALGVHHYLKYTALAAPHLTASNLHTIAVPPPRPAVVARHTVTAKWRYAWNVCTHGYPMAWWGWDRWELELDFMALQGVNLPLLFTGQEYIWARVFRQFGATEAELAGFFSAPVFQVTSPTNPIRCVISKRSVSSDMFALNLRVFSAVAADGQ